MSSSIQYDDVIECLEPDHVIIACGVDAAQRGRAYRLRTCPACGMRPKRQGAAIYRRKPDNAWHWTHHGHGCGGDLLDLIAAAESIDRRREFPRLLARAAQMAGMVATDPDLARRIAEHRRANAERRARKDADRVTAVAMMPALWDGLARYSAVGERYLAGRGLDVAELRARDAVRYSSTGEPAVAMRALDTGAIVGVQYRATGEKRLHCVPYSEPSSSALYGRPSDLATDGVDVAVVVEGLADTLAAVLAFPGCAVFGAAGADHLDTVAAAVAPRVRDAQGWLLLVPDDDGPLGPGARAMCEAICAVRGAGLELDRDVHLVDLGAHHDLADAWRSGWRYTWSATGVAA